MNSRIALLPWGDAIEDFLDPLDITLEQFRDEVEGGWLFGYVDALARVGVQTVIVCFSERLADPVAWRHKPTGAELIVIPLPRSARRLRQLLEDRYAWSARAAASTCRGPRRLAALAAHELAPYCATAVRPLARALRSRGAAAILCQEYEYQRFDVAVLLGRALGLPVFGTFQGGDAPRTWLERPLRRLALRSCDGLIVASDAEVKRVRSTYGVARARIARIPNPLDIELWDQARRGAWRDGTSEARALRVIWHGRVDMHRKGLDVLLDAWAAVSQRTDLPPRELVLVGSGADDDELRERLASCSLAGVTWVRGYELDKRKLADRLAASDLYVFPSRHEGFPVALLEAMACGLGVVAADAPGVSEILPDDELSGGRVVPRGDAGALASAIAEFLADAARREQAGAAASRRVTEAFTLDAVGESLRDFLLTPPQTRATPRRGAAPWRAGAAALWLGRVQ